MESSEVRIHLRYQLEQVSRGETVDLAAGSGCIPSSHTTLGGAMTVLKVGMQAPDFEAPIDGGESVRLSTLRGRKVVLYFYPKDSTPGCTTEACGFRDALPDFSAIDAEILGVSKDSVKRHDNFRAKYDLPFHLVADTSGEVCEAYGVWVLKKNYGREYMGIQRATFLVDEAGVIREIWRKVRVKGHVDAVLAAAQAL